MGAAAAAYFPIMAVIPTSLGTSRVTIRLSMLSDWTPAPSRSRTRSTSVTMRPNEKALVVGI
ncbi:MAG: hypothetical protein ACREUE_01435 [Panacagrimonas sp.]